MMLVWLFSCVALIGMAGWLLVRAYRTGRCMFPPNDAELRRNPTAFWINVMGNIGLIAIACWAFVRNGIYGV